MAYKHLTFNDRLKIEAWQKVGTSPRVMAEKLGVHISTIYRELKRGQYEHLNSDYTTEQRYILVRLYFSYKKIPPSRDTALILPRRKTRLTSALKVRRLKSAPTTSTRSISSIKLEWRNTLLVPSWAKSNARA